MRVLVPVCLLPQVAVHSTIYAVKLSSGWVVFSTPVPKPERTSGQQMRCASSPNKLTLDKDLRQRLLPSAPRLSKKRSRSWPESRTSRRILAGNQSGPKLRLGRVLIYQYVAPRDLSRILTLARLLAATMTADQGRLGKPKGEIKWQTKSTRPNHKSHPGS